MIEKILSEEELQKVTADIWDRAQEDIKKNIEYAISSELRGAVQSRTRQIISKRLDPIISAVVEKKTKEIEEAMNRHADRIIKKATERFETSFVYHTRQALCEAVSNPLQHLGSTLSNLMYQAIEDVVKAEQEERKKLKGE